MGGMKELWEHKRDTQALVNRYPHKAGWKDPGISRENAERIDRKGTLSANMNRMKQMFDMGFEGTADELAERLKLSPFSVRPACTHLLKLNIIQRTPERRIGAGGGTAAVLKLKDTTI